MVEIYQRTTILYKTVIFIHCAGHYIFQASIFEQNYLIM